MQGLAGLLAVVTSELGEFDCASTDVEPLMTWADTRGITCRAWAWTPPSCSASSSLIQSCDGAPTSFGQGV